MLRAALATEPGAYKMPEDDLLVVQLHGQVGEPESLVFTQQFPLCTCMGIRGRQGSVSSADRHSEPLRKAVHLERLAIGHPQYSLRAHASTAAG